MQRLNSREGGADDVTNGLLPLLCHSLKYFWLGLGKTKTVVFPVLSKED